MPTLTLTLLSRSYCSLCQQMRQALLPWQTQYGFDVSVIDIDERGQEAWLARCDELVPVLLHGDHEICHWHLDEAALGAYLARLG